MITKQITVIASPAKGGTKQTYSVNKTANEATLYVQRSLNFLAFIAASRDSASSPYDLKMIATLFKAFGF